MDSADNNASKVFVDGNGIKTSDDNILSDLCEQGGRISTEIKDCLSTYKLNTPTKQLKCHFNHFKKSVIVETLLFLNTSDRNWKDYVKEACIHELICRIQNLLIDNCQFCNKHYATSVSEVPLLQCCLCGQGVHIECLKKLLGEN